MSGSLLQRSLQSQIRRIELASLDMGIGRAGSIPADMTFRHWCEHLAESGLKIDRKPFKLSDRPALIPVYDAVPSTVEEARGRGLVVQKATQLGLTVWEVLADIYMAKKFGPVNIGLFLPDQATAGFKSEHRFMPILRSHPEVYRELVNRVEADGTLTKIGEGNILTREFARSLLMFLWTSGKVSTESRPMDIVSLDEVQEMTLAQIDKVLARLGDSMLAFWLMLSTANMPELDINAWYLQGTQEVWHTRCDHCGVLSDLSDPAGIFPDRSIAWNNGQVAGAPVGEHVWTCPSCGGWIPDAQVGAYIAANPAAKLRSFLLPRTISPRMTPGMFIEQWGRAKTGDQRKSFYNRTLARPYIDADQLPVTMAHCLAAVEEGKRLGVQWETSGRDCYMGVDQMGGFNCVVIKRRLASGHQAVVHVEAVFGNDPFARCADLMGQFGVAVCVVEQLPNVNDARRFANAFPRRVFLLTQYTDLGDDMMRWGDELSHSDKRTEEESRTRFTVTVNQYKAMQATLYRIRDKVCVFPDPSQLDQDVLDEGRWRRMPILRDWVFSHYTKTALVVEQNEETRKPRPKVMKVGLDPHFSFATMMCDLAWARSHGTTTFIMPPTLSGPETPRGEAVAARMPGLPAGVIKMIDSLPPGVCGRCSAFKEGRCTERELTVGAADPGCQLFVPT